jgi:hypothetical protein
LQHAVVQHDVLRLARLSGVHLQGVLQHAQGERCDRDRGPRYAEGRVAAVLEGPQAVRGDHQHGRQDPDEAQIGRRVAVEGLAGAGLGADRDQLGVAFAGHHEQGAERRDQQEPLAQRYGHRDTTGDGAQQEAAGHHGQVDHRQVLQHRGVEDAEGDGQPRSDQVAQRQAAQSQDERHHRGHRDAELPGRDGAEPLLRVEAVLLDVPDVIEQVDRGADQAEGDEGERHPAQHVGAEQPAGGQRRQDDEEVLHPLAWAERSDGGGQPAHRALEGLGHRLRGYPS